MLGQAQTKLIDNVLILVTNSIELLEALKKGIQYPAYFDWQKVT